MLWHYFGRPPHRAHRNQPLIGQRRLKTAPYQRGHVKPGLARLGLRASAVAALRLRGIDWEQGPFQVAGEPTPNRASAATGCRRGAPALRASHRPCVETSHVFITAMRRSCPFPSGWSARLRRALRLAQSTHRPVELISCALGRHRHVAAADRAGAIRAVLRHARLGRPHLHELASPIGTGVCPGRRSHHGDRSGIMCSCHAFLINGLPVLQVTSQ